MTLFNSLFRKTLTVYICVVVIALAVLSAVVSVDMKRLLTQQQVMILNRESNELLPYLERAHANHVLNPAFDALVSRDKKIDHTTVNILLLHNGNNLRKIQRLTSHLIANNQVKNAAAVKRVLNGHRIRFIGPFSTTDQQAALTVGVPLVRNGKTVGALFLHTSIRGLPFTQVTRNIVRLLLPIVLLSTLALYMTTRRLSRPLRQVTQAVDAFGHGNYKQRIRVKTRDEVGRLAETFNQMADQLEQLEQLRKELMANVSHELRTPLTSVRGFVQGMLDGVIPTEDHPKYLAVANKELQRLTSILNSMLDLAAIETGRIQLDMQPVQWSTVVNKVRDQVKVRMDEKQLRWDEHTASDSVRIWGDPERFAQILFNILDNAVRHTAKGGISISSTESGRQLRVQIQDSGEGITQQSLSHIWEPFFTAGHHPTKESAQSGLGLTITKHLVELMNGAIDVESTVGQGTQVTIRFPILAGGKSNEGINGN